MFEGKHKFIKEIIWQVMFAGMAVVLAFFVVKMFHQRTQEISLKLRKSKAEAYLLLQETAMNHQLQQDLAFIGDSDKIIFGSKPPADYIVEFKDVVDGVAKKFSLRQKVEFGHASDDQKFIDYSIILDGNATSLIKYLNEFEKLPYLTAITSIEYQSKTDLGWQGDSQISMKVKVYTKPVE